MVWRTARVFLLRWAAPDRAGERGQRVGKLVEAVDARDLFQHVDLALHVEPPGGDGDAELAANRRVMPNPSERRIRSTLAVADLDAEDALDLGAPKRNGRTLDVRATASMRSPTSSPPAVSRISSATRAQASGRDAAIGAALVAVRGVGVHAVAPGHAADRRRIEPRRLDQHVRSSPR